MAETTIQHRDPHEQRDVSRRGLLVFAGTFIALVAISIGVLWLVFGVRQGGFSAAVPLGPVAADSELQQRQQLSRYLAAQSAELERIGWTDASHRTAKLPISDAMALLAGKRRAP
jgi:hypothetical protein